MNKPTFFPILAGIGFIFPMKNDDLKQIREDFQQLRTDFKLLKELVNLRYKMTLVSEFKQKSECDNLREDIKAFNKVVR